MYLALCVLSNFIFGQNCIHNVERNKKKKKKNEGTITGAVF